MFGCAIWFLLALFSANQNPHSGSVFALCVLGLNRQDDVKASCGVFV